ncbi:MAG: methyltransferase domain-containing protein [Bacteroidota bacterium]
MEKELSKEDIKHIAAQLRKPAGDKGLEVGNMMNSGNGPMNLHALAVLDPQPGDRILEIGMGNGHFVKNILNIDQSITYVGCDYSELMVDTSAQKNAQYVEADRAAFIHADIKALPLEDHTFDKIFTINTFYFWEDHKAVIHELRRVLKEDGELIIAVRPKENLEQFPVTQHGFTIMENEAIIDLFLSNGFGQVEMTSIHEPDQVSHGQRYERHSLIMKYSN